MRMGARESEATMLQRCLEIARGACSEAQDAREANVLRVASSVLRSAFPKEALRLAHASESYFSQHPHERLSSAEIVRRGWIIGMPRLRDMLSRELRRSLG